MDFQGQGESETGGCEALAFIDPTSRYVVVIPLPDREVATWLQAFLDNIVFRYGPPLILHLDAAPEFLSEALELLAMGLIKMEHLLVHRTCQSLLLGGLYDDSGASIGSSNRLCARCSQASQVKQDRLFCAWIQAFNVRGSVPSTSSAESSTSAESSIRPSTVNLVTGAGVRREFENISSGAQSFKISCLVPKSSVSPKYTVCSTNTDIHQKANVRK
jgi:hypothetical protein